MVAIVFVQTTSQKAIAVRMVKGKDRPVQASACVAESECVSVLEVIASLLDCARTILYNVAAVHVKLHEDPAHRDVEAHEE